MTDGVTVIHGRCEDVLPTLAASSVDLIATDPPYGTTAQEWDRMPDLPAMWEAFRRVLKPDGAVVMTASQPFTSRLVLSNEAWFRCEWVWEKTTGTGFLDAKKKPLKCHEAVLVFAPKEPTYNPQKWRGERNHSCKTKDRHTRSVYAGEYGRPTPDRSGIKYPRSVIRFGKHSSTERHHKTQKPVDLFDYLIRTYSDEGDWVLDPYAGSGTTLVACRKTCRRGIGIEMQAKLIPVIHRRLKGAETPLFQGLGVE